MSNDNQMTPARQVYATAHRAALVALASGDPERAKAAASRVALAFQAAASSSPQPAAWANLDPASIAACVGASITTDLYPGGAMPPVYLVPQGGQLQWRITHRGLCELARREGYHLRTVPVGRADELRESFGLVVEHVAAGPRPQRLADLAGMIVVERHRATGDEMAFFVPGEVIDQRRRKSKMGDRGPWSEWPIEMAAKTAILYLGARGALSISTGMRAALEAEPVEARAEIADRSESRRGKAALPDYSATPPTDADRVEEPEYADPGAAVDGER
jgi:recombinational DNA repair protein RecT